MVGNIKEIINRQRGYFITGATKPVDFRLEKLRLLKQVIRAYEEKIEAALWEDLHKSAYESYLTEISIVLQELEDHIRHLRRWTRPLKVSTPLHLFGGKSRIIYEPLGVALIVAPWNYPFQLLMAPLIGAVAAGNCVILKPSPYAPAIVRVMAAMVAEAFSPEHVTLVPGGREVNQALWSEKMDVIFFTGSPALGRIVMKAAAEHLTPVILELGGKSPCIVDRTADIDLAARRLAWGKCLNAGQTCIAPDYLFVHSEVKQSLLEKIRYYISEFYGGQPRQSADYPRIINLEAFDRILSLMQGEHIVWGGESNREEKFIAPTVIDRVTPESPVMQQEIFGPLLPVLEFRDLAEVIRFVNSGEKPLALYYFGKTAEARRVIEATTSGGVCVNDTIMHIANVRLPFGGVGNSGIGKYHGHSSFLAFSNRRSVLFAARWWDIPLRYPPYKALSLLKKMPGF